MATTISGDSPTGAHFFPASSAQHRLWFLEQFQPGRALYNVPIAVRLTGPLDAALLEHSLQKLIARHEALRTYFALQQDQPVQIVAPTLPFRLSVTDLRLLPVPAREAQACAIARAEARRPFDLRHPPLFNIQLLKLADAEHIFLLTVHHIIFDGWSLTVFFRELAAIYAAAPTGRPPVLPELAVQYGDFTVWQRERFKALSSRLAWWKEKLAGSPAMLELPADRPRPAVQGYHGRTETLALPAGVREPLEALGRREGATLFMTLLAAFQVLLHRHTGQTDLLIGTPVAGRNRKETESVLGLFINTLVLRGDLGGNPTFRELLGRVRTTVLDALAHEEVPFEKLVEKLSPERSLSRAPLFQVMFVHERAPLEPVQWPGLQLAQLELDSGTAKFDLTLYLVESAHGLTARAEYDSDLFDPATIQRLLAHLAVLLQAVAARPDQRIAELPLLTEAEVRLLAGWNGTAADYPRDQTIHGLIAGQVARTPDAVAVVGADASFTYRELDHRAAQLAAHLRALGVGPGTLVGICVERSALMMVGLLGILQAGGAYLPLDPKFPVARLGYIIADAGVRVVLTQGKFLGLLPAEKIQPVCLDELALPAAGPAGAPTPSAHPADPAYVLYTSGSTGQPKGVVVAHQNVVNFFAGMNRALGPEPAAGPSPGCWLAVTTISFDISVLELFWTLTRGFKVVIHPESGPALPPAAAPVSGKKMDFSLFYFASEADRSADRPDKYRLLIEGAKFADQHGFSAVWTPERHFHSFGGLFPNPAVTGAAVAAVTKHVGVRGGSVVLPLHHPLRVAEEWAVVDNLSHGRVGVAFASGWHERDFALAPQCFARRREVLEENLALVRQLWRGESVRVPGSRNADVDIAIHPRPLQPELPVWITASGQPETFRKAGELGAHVITHLLGQSFTELEEKIRLYREARRAHGHDPEKGTVTLMLHTFVGTDPAAVRETVREPLCTYLKQSADLVRTLAHQPPAAPGAPVDAGELAAHIDAAFDRYFKDYGLFGTPESCGEKIERLKSIGVDEVACLIDFGVATDTVLASLDHLDRLKTLCAERAQAATAAPRTIAEQIVHHGVTHLQCTPSLAKTLVAQPAPLAALRRLRQLLVGGEPLPAPLARQLHQELPGRVYNMYGPTETTVWSTVHRLDKVGAIVPLGRPIANTRLYVLDRGLQPVPLGTPGELFIGGESVATGYLHRPELTAEKFLPDPFSHEHRARMYRTGDLVRFRANGELEFLGRLDHQAKVRGHRVELGEIESVLQHSPGVREAVVVARPDAAGDQQLVAYLTASPAPVIEELRRFLGGHLPDYMVPATYVVLDRLPLTPNGKIDRAALPAPDAARPALATTFAAPRPGTEQVIAEVWSKVLNVKNPGAEDNFFDLGGHSLRVAQVQAKLHEQHGIALPLLALFQYPTIRALARCLDLKPADGRLQQQVARRAQQQRAAVRPKPQPVPVSPT